MGKIVTIASQKGGVGKTTTALNFAYSLSRFGESVLLIDADPQGGMSVSTNIRKRSEKGLIDCLAGTSQLNDVAFYTNDKKMVIMGVGTVDPTSVRQLEQWARDGELASTLQVVAKSFNYVIIDAPAGLGSLTLALLGVSQGVVLASQCKALSLKTLPKMLALISWVQENENPDLLLEGIVVTMRNNDNAIENDMFVEIRGAFPPDLFFNNSIAHDLAYEKASLRSIPVGMLKEGKLAARNYFQLAVEYKEREMVRAQTQGDDDADSGLF